MSVEAYILAQPVERQQALNKLRETILRHLPKGFEEMINYGMPGYVVPHSIYPSGYHCDPKLPLPFMNFASQKNSINFYHMGIYANPTLLEWFTNEFPKHSSKKLDMGKSCIRFKKPEDIPFDLIGELVSKIAPSDWISLYESNVKK
ncbi:MAG: hypothetical protein RL264_2002 [Bacteroidota bacterium]|jgi:uncharacterized protein YdhG (YjbR/CyaY superfamily)